MNGPWCAPDYRGNGFLNLVATLVEAAGGAPRHAPLAALAPAELRGAANLVFLIFDGLGDAYLREHGAGGRLLAHARGAISAVFPSTTAAAITTSYTGCSPLEHGLIGWFAYFGEAGCVGAPLPFKRRGETRPIPAEPARLFPAPPFFGTLAMRPIVVTERSIVGSTYNLHHCAAAERRAYGSLPEFVAEIAAAVRSGPERKFVYAYWPQFDKLAHEHGVASAPVREHFRALDAAFEELLARLAGTDSVLVATADHGFVDSPREKCLELPPELVARLRFPLCGERRVAFCHAHSPREFLARARDALGERAEVRESRALAEEGWFGPGAPHPRLAERIGDVAILMKDGWTVKDWVPGESRHLHIGNHGGASSAEMLVPLIVAHA
ncbi:MAG: alkaline phosphatase family protein [Burkholderiales bacterium]|nr:alkaline phosphatase family protein [Burkholderiales bacterium]